jgi:predicted ATPase
MTIRLRVQNYRALRHVDWSPHGLCALAGPNGAGKTTLLSTLAFLRDVLRHGLGRAVDRRGGIAAFRYLGARPDEPTMFEVFVGDATWRLEPVLHGSAFSGLPGESLRIGNEIVYYREPNQRDVTHTDPRVTPASVTKSLIDIDLLLGRFTDSLFAGKDDPTLPLISALENFRFHGNYVVADLRQRGSQASSDDILFEDGSNAFSLLRNWRDKRDTRGRFEFVIEGLRAAFPDIFAELDFETAGSTVTIRTYAPGKDASLPVEVAANGFLTALLHLCAVASMPRGGIIAIDEPENGLHPFAIRELVDTLRDRAAAQDLTILLATHAPAFLNHFNREPGQVYVIEPGLDPVPVALDQHRNPEWLAHFSLGDLFLDQDFAAPRVEPS